MVGADGRSRVLLALVVVLSTVLAPATLAAPAAGTGAVRTLGAAQVAADDVLLAVDIQADGDATWRVAYRVRLDDENATAAFESLQRDVRANPENYTATFRERMAATAASAETATGREMAIENVSVTAERRQLPQEYGVLTYRFRWTNFAAVDGPRLRAGDALAGLFLDSQTTLLVSWPAEYRLTSVEPEPTDRRDDAVTWAGALEFADGEPALVVTTEPPASTTTSPGATAGPTTIPPGNGGDGDGNGAGGLPLVALLAIVLLVVGGGVGYLHATGRLDLGSLLGRASTDVGGPTDGGDGGAGEPANSDGDAGGAVGEATGAGATSGTAGDEGPPEELLSNEEQVLRLLEERGGRMKQQQVVQELDWTEAKTSQVVGSLREAGDVETFRIGRENVLTLPDETQL